LFELKLGDQGREFLKGEKQVCFMLSLPFEKSVWIPLTWGVSAWDVLS